MPSLRCVFRVEISGERMTSLRIENLCLQASLELNETVDAYRDRIDVSREAHLTGYLMCHFLMTMCCLGDSVRFDLLMESLKADPVEV